jgi:hypothetical protein
MRGCMLSVAAEADVGRTFGTNVFFGGDGPGIPKLRRILATFSWHCPEIGCASRLVSSPRPDTDAGADCQGMNLVAGTLLLTFPAEEDAFWLLTAIIERMLPSDYYTPTLLVSRADQRVLRDLCARHLPTLQACFERHGMELEVVTFGWFLSLFAAVMPIQTLLRIWDVLFCDGLVVLFRVALAMLKLHEDDILACDSATSIYVYLRNLPAQLVQADRLLKVRAAPARLWGACQGLTSSAHSRPATTFAPSRPRTSSPCARSTSPRCRRPRRSTTTDEAIATHARAVRPLYDLL